MTGSIEDESIDAQPRVESRSRGPEVSRRQVLRTAGITAGAAAVGVGSTQLDPVSPVGESDALIGSTLIIAGTAAAGAGLIGYSLAKNDQGDPDPNGVLEDQIYNAMVAISNGNSNVVDMLQTEFINPSTSRFADTAWSEIRAAAAEAIVNGKTQTTAEQKAITALDATTRRATHNMVERWNTQLLSIGNYLQSDVENNVGVWKYGDGTNNVPGGTTEHNNFSKLADYETTGGVATLYERTGIPNLPGTASDVDGLNGPIKVIVTSTGNSANYIGPFQHVSDKDWGLSGGSSAWKEGSLTNIKATHSSLSTQTVIPTNVYQKATARIYDDYNSISSNVSTYVSNLYSALSQGAISASDIYSPSDLIGQFAGSSKRQRVSAELSAIGISAPSDTTYKAEVSHPGITASSLTGDLYISFSGSPVDLRGGMTLSASQYDLAYLGYTNQANGKYEQLTLSGGSDLQIISLSGVSGSKDISSTAPGSAGGSGEINLGSNPPDRIQNPSSYEQAYNLKIETQSAGTFYAPVSDISTSSGDYILPSAKSPLSGGETISSLTLEPVIDTVAPTEYVADPSTVDSETTKSLLKSQKRLVEDIEKLTDSGGGGGGGGGLFGSGLPSLPGLSTAESAAVVILATLGLSALN